MGMILSISGLIFSRSISCIMIAYICFFWPSSYLIFFSLCYYIEMDFDSGFTDIPTAFYWVVITMTTVGYGDIFPVSGLGKFVGTFCAISGALTMSLPLPVIVSNFEKYYEDQIKLDLLRDRRAKYVDTHSINFHLSIDYLMGIPSKSTITRLIKKKLTF